MYSGCLAEIYGCLRHLLCHLEGEACCVNLIPDHLLIQWMWSKSKNENRFGDPCLPEFNSFFKNRNSIGIHHVVDRMSNRYSPMPIAIRVDDGHKSGVIPHAGSGTGDIGPDRVQVDLCPYSVIRSFLCCHIIFFHVTRLFSALVSMAIPW